MLASFLLIWASLQPLVTNIGTHYMYQILYSTNSIILKCLLFVSKQREGGIISRLDSQHLEEKEDDKGRSEQESGQVNKLLFLLFLLRDVYIKANECQHLQSLQWSKVWQSKTV